MSDQNKNTPKGLKVEATFGQLMSALFVFFIMFVVPIGGYNLLDARYGNGGGDGTKGAYTESSLQKSGKLASSANSSGNTNSTNSDTNARLNDGKVAGISTVKAESTISTTKDVVTFFTNSKSFMLIAGIVILAISVALASSLIFDFLKK